MSKAAKLALIFAIAVIAIAAKQFAAPGEQRSAIAAWQPPSISPAELMRAIGPLEETKVETYN